jgi:hypothetical protein
MKGETLVERGMMAASGWANHSESVMLTSMSDYETRCDPFVKKDRTYFTAHRYIQENWKNLRSGDVVDVQFILGETEEIKEPEWIDYLMYVTQERI